MENCGFFFTVETLSAYIQLICLKLVGVEGIDLGEAFVTFIISSLQTNWKHSTENTLQ